MIDICAPTPAARCGTAASIRDTDIAVGVRRHCLAIGCNTSNTQAAIAWALKSPGHTLQAIREGRKRAEQLRDRQPEPTTPPAA